MRTQGESGLVTHTGESSADCEFKAMNWVRSLKRESQDHKEGLASGLSSHIQRPTEESGGGGGNGGFGVTKAKRRSGFKEVLCQVPLSE